MVLVFSILIVWGIIISINWVSKNPQAIFPFPEKSREILNRYFVYYKRLSPKEKARFEKRTHQFILMKKFIPRGMDEVSLEMKTLIAACANQLTFGLPRVYLQHFKRILVYPDDYYSTINQTYHKGEVNPRMGIIVLSWRAFIRGYFEQEGLNLGLHEMAHALRFENRIHNDEYAFLDKRALRKWDELSDIEIDKINSGENTFFRSYGAKNRHEFFAVAIENFFEKPDQFKEQLPELYLLISLLLNQDLAQK